MNILHVFMQINWEQWWHWFIENLPIIHIPIVGAVVGWFSNWKAIKLTFWPINFIGIRPYLGWQGIIPAQAAKMAALSVDLMTAKLINIKEVFTRLDPSKINTEISIALNPITIKIINEVMEAKNPLLWKTTPSVAKQQIYDKILQLMPQTINNIMEDTKHDINNLLDLKKLAIDTLLNDKRLINRIFLNVGKAEFRFLILSGWYLGLFFGLIQMVICIYYNPWWMLPVFGAVTGYITNWLALKLIFWPIKPIDMGFFTLQGAFIKRQQTVAQEYAKIISNKILTTDRLFHYIIRGANAHKFHAIVNKHIEATIDSFLGQHKHYSQLIIGSNQFVAMKNIAYYRFLQEIPFTITHVYNYATEALQIEQTLFSKMSALSEVEFIGFLRPVFQEDEAKLLALGAVLGFIAGAVQYWAMT